MKNRSGIVASAVFLAAAVGIAQTPAAPASTGQAPAPSAPPAQATPAPAGRGGGRGGPAVISPQIESDGRGTFRVMAPQATPRTIRGGHQRSPGPGPAAP